MEGFAPHAWSAETMRGMVPRYARPAEGSSFASEIQKLAGKLGRTLAISSEGVVHGRGLVAVRPLVKDEVVIDPTALYLPGHPPRSENETYVDTGDGYFQLRPWGGKDAPCAVSYFVNEARGGEDDASVVWKIKHLSRPMLSLRVLRAVPAGEEVLAVYNNDEDEDEASATAATARDDVVEDVEGQNDRRPAVIDLTVAREEDHIDLTRDDDAAPRHESRMRFLGRDWPRGEDAVPKFLASAQTTEVLVDESVVPSAEVRSYYTRCKCLYGSKEYNFRRGAGDDVRGGLFPVIFTPEEDDDERGRCWCVRVEDIYKTVDGTKMIAFAYCYSFEDLERDGASVPDDFDRDLALKDGRVPEECIKALVVLDDGDELA